MSEQARIETAVEATIDNCELFRAQIAEQAREIERLQAAVDGLDRQNDYLADEIAALKQPISDGPDCDRSACGDFSPDPCDNPTCSARRDKQARQSANAVVMPERQMYTAYLSGVVPSNAVEVNSYRDGWNACLDEVARLNQPASAGDDAEEAFEQYARPLGFDLTVPRIGDYIAAQTVLAWEGFKAGAAWQARGALFTTANGEQLASASEGDV